MHNICLAALTNCTQTEHFHCTFLWAKCCSCIEMKCFFCHNHQRNSCCTSVYDIYFVSAWVPIIMCFNFTLSLTCRDQVILVYIYVNVIVADTLVLWIARSSAPKILTVVDRSLFFMRKDLSCQCGRIIEIMNTMKPVYNDHLMGYFSAFWSSSRWPTAT